MLIRIDFESDVPIYVQLKRQLIQGIAKGELKQGDSLPSVRVMAEEIGINMHTVNKAYNMLKSEGFVSIDRRKGAVVTQCQGEISSEFKENLSEELNALIAEAYAVGMGKADFMDLCGKIYCSYDGECNE